MMYCVITTEGKQFTIKADSFFWTNQDGCIDFFDGEERVAVFRLDAISGFFKKEDL